MIKQIKRCPFCNNDVTVDSGLANITFIRCGGCGLTASFLGAESIKAALKMWNKRSKG